MSCSCQKVCQELTLNNIYFAGKLSIMFATAVGVFTDDALDISDNPLILYSFAK